MKLDFTTSLGGRWREINARAFPTKVGVEVEDELCNIYKQIGLGTLLKVTDHDGTIVCFSRKKERTSRKLNSL